MGVDTLPDETEKAVDDGRPVEGAEATRSAGNLFEFSEFVHAGAGAAECEHREDGECKLPQHFHAWICLPNSIQHADILQKARAAKARRKRAMRDAGTDTRQASDAYVMLESDLDDALTGDRKPLIREMAERRIRKTMGERINGVIEDNDAFENYYQDSEEWRRLTALPVDERPTEEYADLTKLMDDFEEAVRKARDFDTDREIKAIESLSEEALRGVVRDARLDGESSEAHMTTYYAWLGFIGTREVAKEQRVGSNKRYFATLEDFRNGPPEAINAIDNALRDLEGRMSRGGASGN